MHPERPNDPRKRIRDRQCDPQSLLAMVKSPSTNCRYVRRAEEKNEADPVSSVQSFAIRAWRSIKHFNE